MGGQTWSAGIEWLDHWLLTLWPGCGVGGGGWESRAGAESQLLGGGGGRPARGEAARKQKHRYHLLHKEMFKIWMMWFCSRSDVTSAACGPCEPQGNLRCRGRPPQPAGWPPSAHPGPWGSRSPAPVSLWAGREEKGEEADIWIDWDK